MTLEQYSNVFEALDNSKRREIISFILQEYFVSKNELAVKFDLKRASLNHHLEILRKADLIYEISLSINGKSHNFVFPAVKIDVSNLVQKETRFEILNEIFKIWKAKQITPHSWKILQENLFSSKLPTDLKNTVENRLFPIIGLRSSSGREFCFIYKENNANSTCYTCKNILCSTHAHQIDRKHMGMIILCPDCISKFFG